MKTPNFCWAQSDTHIFIDINLQPSNDFLKFEDNIVTFNNNDYELNFKLYKECKVMNVKKNRIIELILEKTEKDEWIRLTEVRNLYKNQLSVNWSKMNYEEELQENNNNNNNHIDMEKMMAEMQMTDNSVEEKCNEPEACNEPESCI